MQRDFSIDEDVFSELFYTEEQKENVVIALNFADQSSSYTHRSRMSAISLISSVIPSPVLAQQGITEYTPNFSRIISILSSSTLHWASEIFPLLLIGSILSAKTK